MSVVFPQPMKSCKAPSFDEIEEVVLNTEISTRLGTVFLAILSMLVVVYFEHKLVRCFQLDEQSARI